MKTNSSNNARIAKNTIFLYFRMLIILLVTLYTSRIILKTLGVEDYGIFNVVGGVVTMFGFLNSTMAATTQRYISYSLGKNDFNRLVEIFSTCIISHVLIAIIIFFLLQSIGCWFLFNKLVIPSDRLIPAFCVFQCTTLSAVVSIISVPYNSDIIAHEKMSAFAYISIAEVVMKLLIVYLLRFVTFDKLTLYGILLLVVQIITTLLYVSFCRFKFIEARCKIVFNKNLFKEMFSFAGWNLWGSFAAVLFNQGLNILLNLFFGPTVNAAKGIANQVDGAVKQFSTSFQMALNPQITKTYAIGDIDSMHMLVYRSSKFTFFLMFAIALPLLMETPIVLKLWLGIVPEWTVEFVRLLIIIGIIDAVSNPMMTSASATGKVKIYQSVVGGILLCIVPFSYIVLKLGGDPVSVFIVHFFVGCIAFVARLCIVKRLINLSLNNYFVNVVLPCMMVCLFAVVSSYLLKKCLNETLSHSILIIICSGFSVCIFAFYFGLNKSEKIFIKTKVRNLFNL